MRMTNPGNGMSEPRPMAYSSSPRYVGTWKARARVQRVAPIAIRIVANDEKRALPESRCGTVPDKAPYDVVGIDEVSQKSGTDDELMDERLVAIFEAGRLHAMRFPSEIANATILSLRDGG